MPFPRQRGDSSPESSNYFSDHSSPRGLSPIWRSSKGRIHGSRRLWQILGLIVAVVVTVFLTRSTFSSSRKKDPPNLSTLSNKNQFIDYEGALDCRLSTADLYTPPNHSTPSLKKSFPYCDTRAQLLTALSSGGRHGFDAPYSPKGCHYKWYSPLEICMIIDRFDGIVFIGDESIGSIYAAFNILLRHDLALGALENWKMTPRERDNCRCNNQFTRSECSEFWVTSSSETAAHEADVNMDYRAPLYCNKKPHFYLPIKGSPSPSEHLQKFQQLLDLDPHSWAPVATIHSLGLSTGFQWDAATASMDEWLTVADNSGRNSPFLWVGPSAAGHLKPPEKIMMEGNNAVWHYTVEMGKEAEFRGVESLALFNATLQAGSWDGSHYGQRVALVEAMMVVNWLAKLETT
ncbi:MAG: hypothetical protein M1828_004107 [Chrysothrix sp. TS-e1954]|nr:MAG: hypothetical protein M1828_004107 [Chrysothrix sp. TS-e1954]